VNLPPSLGDLLQARAERSAAGAGYCHLEPDGAVAASRSFAELDVRARSIARAIAETARPGEVALLLYPPGLEFLDGFFAALAAGVVPAPAPPPSAVRAARHGPRLRAMACDARATLGLTTASLLGAIETMFPDHPELAQVRWIATDRVADDPLPRAALPRAKDTDLALLQYTSGSTSSPKGVMLSHRNVVENLAYFERGWDHDADSCVVTWLPAFHDLGLVYGLLQPLAAGCRCVVLSPLAVLQSPRSWLAAVTAHRGTHSMGPNFAYGLAATRIADADKRGLDLSSWRVALNAAEPVRVETMQQFHRAFAPVGFSWRAFSPGYGLSEATCKVTALEAREEPTVLHVDRAALERGRLVRCDPGESRGQSVVGCGRPAAPTSVRIVDPATLAPCGPDEVGEIWVAGPGVAVGYWGQDELSERELRARLPGIAEPHLRTADLGFLTEGQLFIAGRIKDVIVLHGEKHHPQDIEFSVERCHPAIRLGCVGAFGITEDGADKLVVVAELTARAPDGSGLAGPAAQEIERAIRDAVYERHDLVVHQLALVSPGTVPKTSSGKIQRHALRRNYLAQQAERQRPSSDAWLAPARTGPRRARARLFCLPHAGGGASAFQRWIDEGDPDLEVIALQPPGREGRLREPAFTSVRALAEAAATAIVERTDLPYALYGHSLGALAAYEIAREIARRGAASPIRVFLSGRRGPGVAALAPQIHASSDAELVAALRTHYEAPDSFLAHPRLVAAFLPLLRADFAAGETYEHPVGAAPLGCPITALAGADDLVAPPWSMESWSQCTSAGFALSVFAGGHQFWQRDGAAVLALIHGVLLAGASPHPRGPDRSAER
jgi:acyl-CoA synthetase (AMP-forming)/AMP-acid ligase II/surfactin synthase thioesterase subunit